MIGGKRRFAIGISIFVLCTLIAGCLPGKSPVTLNCAPLGKLQSMLPKAGDNGQKSKGGPTRPHPPVRTGTITMGAKTQLVSQSVGASGGTITVSKEGDPLNGFVIDVPSGAYSGSNTFTVSSAPINGQTFGSDINPITPMIMVNNGGGFADEVMYVRVPVKVPAGYFAMGFLYDEKTKQLEGMPMSGKDELSITVATCHFSNFFISMIEDPLGKVGEAEQGMLKKGVDSGFRPGVDDWQFVNRGSYIASGGHCSGQSQAAMWYYYATPDGKDACLFNRYDNNGNQPETPDFWQDDSNGYRFCSVVHDDYSTAGLQAEKYWDALCGMGWERRDGGWHVKEMPGIGAENIVRLFTYSIKASGLPQLVGLTRSSGGGHAIICYRVQGTTLYVADPNYPGNAELKIEYANGKLGPYKSGANRQEIDAGRGSTYDIITYGGAWTIVPYDKIAERWKQFKAGTIGDNTFPSYQLVTPNAAGVLIPLADGYTTGDKMLKVKVTPGQDRGLTVWRDTVELPWNNGAVELKPGNNLLGVGIFGKVGTVWQYIDFKYVNVVYNSLAIEPSPLTGEANKEYTFTAKTTLSVTRPRYEWAVDGAAQQAKGAQINYTFKKDGAYKVTCKLYDDSTADKKLVGEAEAKATISAQQGGTPPFVRDCKYLSFVLNPKATCVHDQYKDDMSLSNAGTRKPPKFVVFENNVPVTWSGVNFSGSYKGVPAGMRYIGTGSGNFAKENFIVNCSFNGTVSPDGKTIRRLEMTMIYTAASEGYTETWKYEFTDIPFTSTVDMMKDKDPEVRNLIREYVVFSDNNPAAHGKFTATYNWKPESYRSLSGSEKLSSGTGTCLNGQWESYTIKGVGPIRFGLKVNTNKLNGL